MKTFEQFINENKTIKINKRYKDVDNHRLEKNDIAELDDEGNVIKIIYSNGKVVYFKNGKRHREDGPAIVDDFVKSWWIDGKVHRLDGPALEWKNGHQEWWINDKNLQQWEEPEIKLLISNNDNFKKMVKYPKVREKLNEFRHLLSPKDKLLLDLEWDKKI